MHKHYELTEQEIRLIRCLQEEFPVCPQPFRKIGEDLDMTEDQVLDMIRRLQESKCLKRLAAVLYHTTVGYQANAMLVWDVPEDRLEETASRAVSLPQVSHCYRRNREPDFDYNFYTMVHAKSDRDLQQLIDQLQTLIRPVKYCSLRTVRELKKTGMKYFTEA